MAMKELFFKVIIANTSPIPMTAGEMRRYPTHKMFLIDYEEKLINVSYEPANGFDEKRFVKFITRKLKILYPASKIEIVEHQKKIN